LYDTAMPTTENQVLQVLAVRMPLPPRCSLAYSSMIQDRTWFGRAGDTSFCVDEEDAGCRAEGDMGGVECMSNAYRMHLNWWFTLKVRVMDTVLMVCEEKPKRM